MKRKTVFVEEAVLNALRAVARRRGITLAEVTREALSAYVSKRRDRGKSLSIIGIGRSGRRDIAERAEELLKDGFGSKRNGTGPRSVAGGRWLGVMWAISLMGDAGMLLIPDAAPRGASHPVAIRLATQPG